jgi:hypothetical protein
VATFVTEESRSISLSRWALWKYLKIGHGHAMHYLVIICGLSLLLRKVRFQIPGRWTPAVGATLGTDLGDKKWRPSQIKITFITMTCYLQILWRRACLVL